MAEGSRSSLGGEAIQPNIAPERLNMRDPFKMPEIPIEKLSPRTELERLPLESYKLIGILTGPERMKAMLQTSEGRTYFAMERMKIGLNGGVILKITSDGIIVREKMINILGQEEITDIDIQLAPETNSGTDSRNQAGN